MRPAGAIFWPRREPTRLNCSGLPRARCHERRLLHDAQVRARRGLACRNELPPCDESQRRPPASRALADFAFRNLVIDTWSIRNFHPSAEDGDVRLRAFEALP